MGEFGAVLDRIPGEPVFGVVERRRWDNGYFVCAPVFGLDGAGVRFRCTCGYREQTVSEWDDLVDGEV